MYGDEGLKLIKQLKRTAAPHLPPYASDSVRSVIAEIKYLHESVQRILTEKNANIQDNQGSMTAGYMGHLATKRNKRCLAAYHRERLDRLATICWEVGGIPGETKHVLSPSETEFAASYRELMAFYKAEYLDIDLGSALIPPKDVFVMVRVLKDCGEVQTESGPVRLRKDSQHYLKRTDVEGFITQGYLWHVE